MDVRDGFSEEEVFVRKAYLCVGEDGERVLGEEAVQRASGRRYS